MSTPEQQAPEEQTVNGTVSAVITKGNDSWQVSVLPPGSQYTKNLWTKDEEIVGAMQTSIGREGTFYCNVSHWTRQDGQPVRSLWISGYTLDGTGDDTPAGGVAPISNEVAQAQAALQAALQAQQKAQEAPQAPAQPPQQQASPEPNRDLRIMRQSADKCAAWVLAALIQTGNLQEAELTPARIHGFLDSYATRRIRFYETGRSEIDDSDDVPF